MDRSLENKTIEEVEQVREVIRRVCNISYDYEQDALEHVLVYLNNHIKFLEWVKPAEDKLHNNLIIMPKIKED